MSGGNWDPISLPIRPGLYINFIEAAIAAIRGGPRGTVALPLEEFGTADDGEFHILERVSEAEELFGEANVEPIKLAFSGGANKVLAYTLPELETVATTLEKFETRQFNVFVWPGLSVMEDQTSIKDWCKTNREQGKHFFTVFGGDAMNDEDPEEGNTRSGLLADEYVINLIVGGELYEKTYTSSEFACYIAGLVAGTPINESITYARIPLTDVTNRLRHTEIETALEAGSLVMVHDGEKVKIEKGICTDGSSIRIISARQAVATDVPKTAADHYIGKLDNNPDGQAALMNAIMAYLERLENNNVLMEPTVELDPDNPPVKDKVWLLISYVEVDSMERIFLTINV